MASEVQGQVGMLSKVTGQCVSSTKLSVTHFEIQEHLSERKVRERDRKVQCNEKQTKADSL